MKTILRALLFLSPLFSVHLPAFSQQEDSVICNRIFSYAFEHKLIQQPMGSIVAAVGKQFIGKPYEAHTLEKASGEEVVTNLHSFDCVTYVENVLALARSIKSNRLSFGAYREELTRFRYRGGRAEDYSSRLHYFSEWIHENEKAGLVQDITKFVGGESRTKKIDFMTQHASSYPPLAADSLKDKMGAIETRLSSTPSYVVATKNIKTAEQGIRDGDVVAIATAIPGLDISHTGIAVRAEDGTMHLMHAPDTGGKVHISAEQLSKYVAKSTKNSGIMVARPVDFSD